MTPKLQTKARRPKSPIEPNCTLYRVEGGKVREVPMKETERCFISDGMRLDKWDVERDRAFAHLTAERAIRSALVRAREQVIVHRQRAREAEHALTAIEALAREYHVEA